MGEAGKQVAELIIPPLLAELENNTKYEFLYAEEAFQRLVRRYSSRYGGRQPEAQDKP